MKNSILIKRVILVFCMISIMIIGSGCAAKKTVLENQGKTECYLDEKDATKFIYNGQQYTILNNTVDKNSLGDWIGFIQKYVALDENYNIIKKCDMGVNVVGDLSDLIDHTDGTAYYVPYLNVYKTENEGDMNNLVVDVDNDFHKAIPSENAKDGDLKIIFKNQNDTKDIENDLPQIDKEDVRNLTWEGKTYQITDQVVPNEKIGDYLCTLSGNITFDAETGRELTHDELNAIDIIPGELSNQKRETWIYDSVYTVIGKDKDSLAVEINYKCVYAILKD